MQPDKTLNIPLAIQEEVIMEVLLLVLMRSFTEMSFQHYIDSIPIISMIERSKDRRILSSKRSNSHMTKNCCIISHVQGVSVGNLFIVSFPVLP